MILEPNIPGRPELLHAIGRPLTPTGNSKENYQSQLGFDVEDLARLGKEIFLKNGELKILDIGGNSSTAIVDLKKLLVSQGIPESKIHLNKVDLYKLQQNGVHFINGNLEDEDFLISLVHTLGAASQGIIFMNQVSQYLGDRLKIIKFISEFLLKKEGKFFFNLVSSTFYSGDFPFSVLEKSLHDIMLDESDGFHICPLGNSPYSHELRLYEIQKYNENANLEFPEYGRVIHSREMDGLKITAYNFRRRMNIENLNTILHTKGMIEELI